MIRVLKKNPCCPFCRHPFGLPLPPVNQSIVRLVQQLRERQRASGVVPADASVEASSAVRQESSLFELPEDILREIMFHCGPAGMARLARTCKRLHTATDDAQVWRELCRARWPFVSLDQHANWKRCYAAHRSIQRGWAAGRAGDFRVETFRGHTDYVTAFQLYRNVLVTASADRTVRVWRAGGAGEDAAPTVLEGHEGPVHAVQFTEALIVSGADDSTARSWDTATGVQVGLMRSTDRITALRFDDTRGFVASANGQTKVWDMKHGTLIRTVAGHTAPVHSLWCDEREQLYTCAADGVRIWDVGSGRCSVTIPTPATALHVNPREVVTGGADGLVRVFDTASGRCLAQMEHTRWQPITAMACDGTRIVSASADGSVAVWDYASRARLHTLADHRGAVHAVQFDDGKIVTAGEDNSIKVWNTRTGERMYTLLGGSLQRRANNPPHPTRPGVSGMAFDEARIVASINSLVRVYNFDVSSATGAAAGAQ